MGGGGGGGKWVYGKHVANINNEFWLKIHSSTVCRFSFAYDKLLPFTGFDFSHFFSAASEK